MTATITECREIAKSKGWDTERENFLVHMALLHTEISEAVEDFRIHRSPQEIHYDQEKPTGIPIELADLIIRVFDVCAAFKIDIESAIRLKMDYNKTRPYRHGGKAC